MTKKKPAKKRTGTPAQFVPGLMRDARASVSLDGTQSCPVCDSYGSTKHTCGRREISPEERAVVDAARLFVVRHTDGAHCSFELDPHNCGSSEQLINACRALRAARGK